MVNFRFSIPYMPALPKNRRYIKKGFVKNPEMKKAQHMVALLYKQAAKPFPPPLKRKYYIGIKFYKKTLNTDIQNFINPIVDAIFDNCIDFKDNWVSIMYADWFVDKKDPRFIIEIKYE